MIIGIGIDLIDCRRVSKLLECYGEKVLHKLMLPQERAFYERKQNFSVGVAKVFSVKEAVAKALHTYPVWREIELYHTQDGAPFVKLYGLMHDKLIQASQFVCNESGGNVHVSITDEYPYVTTFCVIECETK